MSESAKTYNLAICGLGRAGTIHTGNCIKKPNVNIKYFVELDLDRANKVKEEFKLVSTTVVHGDDFKKTVLSDPDVDGVIIATVTHSHEDYVKLCIEAKKPIFCEKPIAENLKDSVSCYDAAEKAGVPLFCAFNRRFDATHRAVKDASDKGEVGRIQMVKICSRDSPLPSSGYLRISGGIYHDCAVHDIDMACWMLKEYPVQVFSHASAFCGFIREMDDVDTVAITMKFKSRAIAVIDLSRFAAYGYDQRVEVFGEDGMLESLNECKTNIRKSNKDGLTQDPIKFSFPQRYAEAYLAELNHFLNVIDGAPSMITKKDVLMVSLIASACEHSQRTGKAVDIDEKKLMFHATGPEPPKGLLF